MDSPNRCSFCDDRAGKLIKNHVEDYCAASTIHGVQYLTEKGRPFSERVWWVVVFIAGFLINCYMITKIWQKWNNSPVIVSFSDQVTPVWEVPFPAVTVCSNARYDASSINLKKAMKEAIETDSITQNLTDISMLCNFNFPIKDFRTTNESVVELYDQIGFKLNELILSVFWRRTQLTVNSFTKIMTEDGPCYTFNMLHAQELFRNETTPLLAGGIYFSTDWSLENGYSGNIHFNKSYPFRVGNSGLKEALEVILMFDASKFDHFCHGVTRGFKVTLHHPAQYPPVTEKYFIVPVDKEVVVSITPDIMTTSETLRSYSPEDRWCYFSSERKLTYFNVYTQQNCEFECLTNYTIKKCDCVGFFMPRNNNSIPICGAGNKKCMQEATWEVNKDLMIQYDKNRKEGGGCNCLPSCTSIKYSTDVTQSSFDVNKLFTQEIEFNKNIKGKNISALIIYFSEKYFTTSKRSELYGVTDFIANCGGLLSLFSGLSFLSIVEFVYYLTMRCFNNFRGIKQDKELEDIELSELRLKES